MKLEKILTEFAENTKIHKDPDDMYYGVLE